MTFADLARNERHDNFPANLGIDEVDFDTFDPSEPTWHGSSATPHADKRRMPVGIDVSWDSAVYMKPCPSTWCYPTELWGKPYDWTKHANDVGSPWGPKLDVLVSRRPSPPPKAVASRLGMLNAEVRLLYNAFSFKTWQNGRGFDTLITVSAWHLGITNHAEFASLIPSMNKAIKEWLANGKDRPRYRRARSCRSIESVDHQYIYTLERGYRHGLHFHELCVVPPELQAHFRLFVRNWWEMKACMAISENAVNVKFAHSSRPNRQYERQQFWFRYIIKTMNPDLAVRKCDGSLLSMVDVMKPLWRWGRKPEILPIACPQLYGIGRNLDQAAQKRTGFRSKFDAGRFDEIYDGSEVRIGLTRKFSFLDDTF